jgi:hypothetical protein
MIFSCESRFCFHSNNVIGDFVKRLRFSLFQKEPFEQS